MTPRANSNERKFAEPRGWAGKWCGYGLVAAETRPTDVRAKEGKFAEPRGWSAKWCGRGLFKRSVR